MLSDQTGNGVDLVEFKLMQEDNNWIWHPFLILVDDDFDGVADRMFLDSNFDTSLNIVQDIRNRSIRMGNSIFDDFNFWEKVPIPPRPKNKLKLAVR